MLQTSSMFVSARLRNRLPYTHQRVIDACNLGNVGALSHFAFLGIPGSFDIGCIVLIKVNVAVQDTIVCVYM